jgi:hypothetical protein
MSVTAAASHALKVSDHDTSPVLTTLFFVSRGDEIDGNRLVRRQPLLVGTTNQNHSMGSCRTQCFAPTIYGDCERWDHGQYLNWSLWRRHSARNAFVGTSSDCTCPHSALVVL